MPAIPPILLKKLYVSRSLRAEGDGFALDLTNPIAPGTITSFKGLEADGSAVPLEGAVIVSATGESRAVASISAQSPLLFPLGAILTLRVGGVTLPPGPHSLKIRVVVQDVGPLEIPVSDEVA
jgi:hypothetical protein